MFPFRSLFKYRLLIDYDLIWEELKFYLFTHANEPFVYNLPDEISSAVSRL